MSPDDRPGDGELTDETIVSVDERQAALLRPVGRFARRVWIPAAVLLAVALLMIGYGELLRVRRVKWLNELRGLGVFGSYETWTDRIGMCRSISDHVENVVNGNRVTLHVEDPPALKRLMTAPEFPGGALTVMLPYEPSDEEKESIKARFPGAGLIVFSRATRTGRQVW